MTAGGTSCVYTDAKASQWLHKVNQAKSEYKHSLTCFGVCCDSNETLALITKLPNSTQLGGTSYHSPKLHPGLCSSVTMWRGTDTHDGYAFCVVYGSREM